jgi:hypothetical protein
VFTLEGWFVSPEAFWMANLELQGTIFFCPLLSSRYRARSSVRQAQS